MISVLEVSHSEYKRLWKNVVSMNKTSISISWVRKRELGLEVIESKFGKRLVFDNEKFKTMFLLKYS
jgi:hypothetical protein